MGQKHTKPCGSFADVKELEYISALHQTGKQLRKDGSIHGKNVCMQGLIWIGYEYLR